MYRFKHHCWQESGVKKTTHTAWKVSKYGVFSGPYFPAFGLNTERFFVSFRIQSECGKIRTRKNYIFGYFSRSDTREEMLYVLLIPFRTLPVIHRCLARIKVKFLSPSEIYRNRFKMLTAVLLKMLDFRKQSLDKTIRNLRWFNEPTEQILVKVRTFLEVTIS